MRYGILVLALSLSACATGPKFSERMDAWVGNSESHLIMKWGPPQSVYVAPDGSRILTYGHSRNMQFGGGTQLQPVISNTRGAIGSSIYTGTTTTYQQVQAPAYNVAMSCVINVRVVDDRIESWQANGNDCN